MPPNAPTIRGREDIQKFYVDLYAQGGTDLEMDTKDVRGHGPLAYEAGALFAAPQARQRHRPARPRQVPVHLEKRERRLEIESTIWSSDLPEMVPMAN